jgi:hypothetical protein
LLVCAINLAIYDYEAARDLLVRAIRYLGAQGGAERRECSSALQSMAAKVNDEAALEIAVELSDDPARTIAWSGKLLRDANHLESARRWFERARTLVAGTPSAAAHLLEFGGGEALTLQQLKQWQARRAVADLIDGAAKQMRVARERDPAAYPDLMRLQWCEELVQKIRAERH